MVRETSLLATEDSFLNKNKSYSTRLGYEVTIYPMAFTGGRES